MSGILLIVLTGTLYPTFLEVLAGEKISVGAPYFNRTASPLIYRLVFFAWPLCFYHGVKARQRNWLSH